MTADFNPDIKVSRQHAINCSYSSWSRHFPKENLIEAKVLSPIPSEFLGYLTADGIRLEDNPYEYIINNSDNDYSDWEDEQQNNDSNNNQISQIHSFQEFHESVKSTILALDNSVVPKLNWSAPKDAKWMLINNSLECRDTNDIYLLLKSSDHIVDDIDNAFDGISEETDSFPFELVLKKFVDVNPALEFRVFIKDSNIVGISSRDMNHYPYLALELPTIRSTIELFFNQYGRSFSESSYILDLYIPKPYTKVTIIDVNPFSPKAESYLYTWDELLSPLPQDEFEFRIVPENNTGSFATKEFSESQVPFDVVDAAVDTSSMVQLMREWRALQEKDES